MPKLFSNALLFAHDAGGAELLSLWALKNVENIFTIAEGPAILIFEKNITQHTKVSFDKAFELPFTIITSTSWESELEKMAIQRAKQENRYCISILDHWVNYKERFLLEDRLILPSEILVADKYALDIAKRIFVNTKIKQVENLYFSKLESQYNNMFKKRMAEIPLYKAKNALYICEPINKHSLAMTGDYNSLYGYTEEDAFEFFLENIDLVAPELKKITIRLHPAQLNRKREYTWMTRNNNKYDIELSECSDLCIDLSRNDIIVGMESMALAIASFIGKHTISAIPKNGKECSLPMKNIIHLQGFTNGN